MKVVLVNPYELGRQPFGLAHPAAWLADAGFDVECLDLSLERLEPERLAGAELVAVYVAMHTATRIAVEALPRIRELAPRAHLCAYGLYAPMNAAALRRLGVGTVLGGEFEPDLLALARRLAEGRSNGEFNLQVSRAKIAFVAPDRTRLPALDRYANLELPGGGSKVVGFVEASRGCKHLCRHCPVVPVYEGRFRVVPPDVVLADAEAQVRAGAVHLSFGDPDFLNGPTHALRVVRAVNEAFPDVTWDATVKIQHLVRYPDHMREFARRGCLFITSAVESLDPVVLKHLAKNHTEEDFVQAARLLRDLGIALAPTFVPFTPWTTVDGYLALLERLVDLALVPNVPAIQLAIRLLVPEGSYLLRVQGFRDRLQTFDEATLGYPWRHDDARVDRLQVQVQATAERAEADGLDRADCFRAIWSLAHAAAGRSTRPLPGVLGDPVPCMSEPWYCCAEPSHQQLASF